MTDQPFIIRISDEIDKIIWHSISAPGTATCRHSAAGNQVGDEKYRTPAPVCARDLRALKAFLPEQMSGIVCRGIK
jgi:hypothetical protein